MEPCKTRGPAVHLVAGSATVQAPSLIHPRGCMRARLPHLDILLARDPCGLKEFLGRGGATVRARYCCEEWRADLTPLLGIPCTIIIRGPPGFLRRSGRFYLMTTRSGAIYLAPARPRKT